MKLTKRKEAYMKNKILKGKTAVIIRLARCDGKQFKSKGKGYQKSMKGRKAQPGKHPVCKGQINVSLQNEAPLNQDLPRVNGQIDGELNKEEAIGIAEDFFDEVFEAAIVCADMVNETIRLVMNKVFTIDVMELLYCCYRNYYT